MPMNALIAGSARVVGEEAARPSWLPAGQARRSDPLSLHICAAVDRLVSGRPALAADTAVVVGSAWGCLESTLRFVDGMATYGDAGSGPAAFTISVHHRPASMISGLLGLHGPASTVCAGAHSGLSALRCAVLLVASGRAPAALAIAADHANAWTRRTVQGLAGNTAPITSGASALLVVAAGVGRRIGFSPRPAALQIDSGGFCSGDEHALMRQADGLVRHSAMAIHGGWWPTAALAAVPWEEPRAMVIRELDHGRLLQAWIDPMA